VIHHRVGKISNENMNQNNCELLASNLNLDLFACRHFILQLWASLTDYFTDNFA